MTAGDTRLFTEVIAADIVRIRDGKMAPRVTDMLDLYALSGDRAEMTCAATDPRPLLISTFPVQRREDEGDFERLGKLAAMIFKRHRLNNQTWIDGGAYAMNHEFNQAWGEILMTWLATHAHQLAIAPVHEDDEED